MSNRVLTVVLFVVMAVPIAVQVWERPMDYRVYWYGANGFWEGVRPMYGETSGLGWPMHYRYPPLFLLLFTPIAEIGLSGGAVLWALGKLAMMFLLAPRLWRALAIQDRRTQWISILIAAPYLVQELRYGNLQFYIVAMVILALIWAKDRPVRAGLLLGFAASLKVWPLFFVPYWLARQFRMAAVIAVAGTLLLTLAPSLVFGWSSNVDFLRQWYAQESSIQMGAGEVWFPNQSIRGVLVRYFSEVDYSGAPDPNYPAVHVASLEPTTLRPVALGLSAVAYLGLLLFARARPERSRDWDGLSFVVLALVQPLTQKYALCMLWWPAILVARIATGARSAAWGWRLAVVAAAVSVLQPLIPGSSNQRLLQTLGVDFWVTVLMGLAIVFAHRDEAVRPGPKNSAGR